MIPHSRPWITADDHAAVLAQLETGFLIEGAGAAELEAVIARRVGGVGAILVGSGSQALLLALRGMDIGPGSRVVLPTYVCPEVLGVVEAIGATPVLADVDEFGMVDTQDEAFASAIDALVLPYLFGRTGRVERYPVATDRIVVDLAQYVPARPQRDLFGAAQAILSFEATKVLAGGEGGAVLSRSGPDLDRLIAMKAPPGLGSKLNLFPFSDLQASLLASQMRRLDEVVARRISFARRYDEAFGGLARAVPMQRAPADVPFRYVLRLADPALDVEDAIAAFASHGVAARRPVASLLHRLRANRRGYPGAEALFGSLISIPLYPALCASEVDLVVDVTKRVLS